MKKKLMAGLILFIVGILAVVTIVVNVLPLEKPAEGQPDVQPEVLYAENFEGAEASSGLWKPEGTAYPEVAEDPGNPQNHGMLLHMQENPETLTWNLEQAIEKGILRLDIKICLSNPAGEAEISLVNSAGKTNVKFGLYGNITKTGAPGCEVGKKIYRQGSLKADTWYHFQIFFDTEQNLYNVFCDKKKIVQNASCGFGKNIAKLRLTASGAESVLIDDVTLSHFQNVKRSYHLADKLFAAENSAPILPAKVTLSDQWGFLKQSAIQWDPVTMNADTFTASGKLEDTTEIAGMFPILPVRENLLSLDFENENTSGTDYETVTVEESNALQIKGNSAGIFPQFLLPEDKIPSVLTPRIVVEADLRVDRLTAGSTFTILNEEKNCIAKMALNCKEGTVCVASYGGIDAQGYYGCGKYAENQWYHLKIILNPMLQRYHVQLNGKTVIRHFGFQNPGTVAGVELSAMDGSQGTALFDNISIRAERGTPEKEISALEYSLEQGEEVRLPELVNVSYKDDFSDVWEVTWDSYPKTASNDLSVSGKAVSIWAKEYGNEVIYPITAQVKVRNTGNCQFYVDPIKGSDSADGTKPERAFKTLERAREAVRNINGNMNEDIRVLLMNGTFHLTEPFVLNADDSATNGHRIYWQAAPGAHPVISGGRAITGWHQVTGTGYYEADLPENFGYFRQLYVEEERATRACGKWTETRGFSRNSEGKLIGWLADAKEIPLCRNLKDVSILSVCIFKTEEYHLYKIEKQADGLVSLQLTREEDPLFSFREGKNLFSGNADILVTGAIEQLDSPGEWCVDSGAGKVYYYPYSDQNMETIHIEAPAIQADQLLKLEGTTGQPLAGIVLQGLDFRFSNWMYPSAYGIGGTQAEAMYSAHKNRYAYEVPGAIRLNHTRDVELRNNVIAHTGGCGIHVYNDALYTRISGNVTYDTSFAGIQVGRSLSFYLNDPRDQDFFGGNSDWAQWPWEKYPYDEIEAPDWEGRVADTLIENNYVTDTGRDFLQATGINIMASLRTVVVHNRVENAAYAGIHCRTNSVGSYLSSGGAAYFPHAMESAPDVGQYIIAYNQVGEACWGHRYGVSDNGSIYSFGVVPGSLIYRNYMGKTSTRNSLYTDNSSLNIAWIQNRSTNAPDKVAGRDAVLDRHSIICSGNDKAGMEDVIRKAGLQKKYEEIKDMAVIPTIHENYAEYNHLNSQ